MAITVDKLDMAVYGTDCKALATALKPSFRVIEHNCDKLPSIYNRYLKEKQFYSLYVRSHMGSGKTTQLRNIIRHFKRSANVSKKELKALIISPRQMFTSCIVNKLKDFKDYRHVKKPYSCIKNPRLVVQVQSLRHFEEIESDTFSVKGYWVVILDEAHSIIDELFTDLMTPQQKRQCITTFVKVLRAIPRWICLDAHLSLDLINIFKAIDSSNGIDKHMICLINTYKRYDFKLVFYRKCLYSALIIRLLKAKLIKSATFAKYKPLLCTQKIKCIFDEDHSDTTENIFKKIYVRDLLCGNDNSDLLVDLHDELKRGKKICITTSTKRQAQLIHSVFTYCGYKSILLTRDSTEEQKRNFASEPDRYINHCQLFIYTTAFQVGIDVSANAPYFDIHYVFMECSTNVPSPGAFVQALGRIRTLKSNTYKVVVMDTTKRHMLESLDGDTLIPLDRNLIIPECNDSIKEMLINYHFKEKCIGKSPVLYTEMFMRLLSCKAKSYVTINEELFPVEQIVNFYSFQYSYNDYNMFVEMFISQYEHEIQQELNKYIENIWARLETSSIYVSTLVNNYHAFIRLPEEMSRSECLLKVCEFTSFPFGFIYTYLFATDNDLKTSYCEQNIKTYLPKCTVHDLFRFKELFIGFMKCCLKNRCCRWTLVKDSYREFLHTFKNEIVFCYSKFINIVVSRAASLHELLNRLMTKMLRVYVYDTFVDLSVLHSYRMIIDVNELVCYNMAC
jgi:hypothetical protein